MISVISACYNQGEYVLEMVESVLNQEFQDFELIIVNDGSTDETACILGGIRDKRICVIQSENKGTSHARNLAIAEAKADIIFNLDADDLIAPDMLKKGYDVFLKYPEAGIVYANCRYFGAKSRKMKIADYTVKGMLIENKIISAAFFKKDDWQKVGGYSESFIYGLEDWDFWLSIIGLGRQVFKINDSVVFYRTYRDHFESRSGNRRYNRRKSLASLSLLHERHQKLYNEFPAVNRKFSRYKNDLDKESVIKGKIRDSICYFKNRIRDLRN